MPQPFVLFGQSHLEVIAASVVTPLALALAVRTVPKTDALIRGFFAAVLLGIWTFWYLVAARRGWLTLGDALPMNLCDWATIATVVALLRPNQKSYELAYFWALGGTLQGLITPDTPYDFPEVRFVIFSVYHGGIIAAVLYLTLGLGWRPYPASLRRVIIWSFVYLGAAGLVDWLLKVDYGFLRAKPQQMTLFNFMPDWPWYIPVLVGLGMASALVYYAPFFVIDLVRRRPRRAAGEA